MTKHSPSEMRALVAGWFSFEGMGATAGDVLARDVVCRWLADAGILYEIAVVPPFVGDVDWRTADPDRYSHVIFVCGPFGNGGPLPEFLDRFKQCRLLGIDLTMLDPLESWNPFEVLLERDSTRTSRPDLVFLAPKTPVPVVGMVLIHPQPEYEERDAHQVMNDALHRLAAGRHAALVPIDTRLDENLTGLRTPEEVDSLMARMDVVLTTRLHGMVLALRNGIPAIVLDPVRDGAKVIRQAAVLEWPIIFTTKDATPEALERAFDFCLSEPARELARKTAERACAMLASARHELLAPFSTSIT